MLDGIMLDEIMFRSLSLVLIACLTASPAFAKPNGPVFTDPEKAAAEDPDFTIQGEYLGAWNDTRAGAQVIALGEGKFDVVLHEGGLPGAGWERGDPTTTIPAERVAEADGADREPTDTDKDEAAPAPAPAPAAAEGEDGGIAVRIAGGELAVTKDGKPVGTLKQAVRHSPTMNAKPPKNGVLLFDEADSAVDEHWAKAGKTPEGYLMGEAVTEEQFEDFTLHLEFRTPYMPHARGQGRGNSGVYLQSRYEVQVLDSFGLDGRDNECGGIYKTARPKVNMAYPPLQWQTYDITFTAAKYKDGRKTANARVTVKHNGVVIHDDVEVPKTTGRGRAEKGAAGPLRLQHHGNQVAYRNVWIAPSGD